MATILKVSKAFRAMKDIGIGEDRTEPVLKKLLKLYEKNWELIEKENYRVLADAIFDEGDNKALEEEKMVKNTCEEDFGEDIQVPDEFVRPLKRLRLRGQEAQLSPFQNSSVSGLNETPLTIPKLEAQQLQLCAPKRSENDPSSSRHADKGKESVSPNMVAGVKNSNMEKPSTALCIKEPAVVLGVRNHKVRASGAHTSIVPKDEPFTDDISTTVSPPYKLPIAAVHTGSVPKDVPFTDDIGPTILPPYELSIAAIHPEMVNTRGSGKKENSLEKQNDESEDIVDLEGHGEGSSVPDEKTPEKGSSKSSKEVKEKIPVTTSKKRKIRTMMADTEEKGSETSQDHDERGQDKTDGRKVESKGIKKGESSKRGARYTHKGTALIHPKEAWMHNQRVNVYCKTKILELLRLKMTARQKEMLGKSFISNFLNLPTTNFPTQLLLQIIRRRIPNTVKGVLRFNIEGTEVDFTLADFGLLTGLSCGEVKYINIDSLPVSTIKGEFFQNYLSPKLVTLREKITEYEFNDDILSVKLAKLAILESIVVAKLPSNKLEPLHLRLVEDDNMFESYPWGRVAYDLLVDSVINSKSSSRSSSMAIFGFAYALIYWAYEIIPKLSENERYGKRTQFGIPRIMNWDLHKLADDKRLEREIFNEKIVVVPIEPTKEEMDMEVLSPLVKMRGSRGKEKLLANEVEDENEEDWEEMDQFDGLNVNETRHFDKGDFNSNTSLNELKEFLVAELATLNRKVDYGFDDLKMKLMKISGDQRKEDDRLPFPYPTATHSQFERRDVENRRFSPEGGDFVDLSHVTPNVVEGHGEIETQLPSLPKGVVGAQSTDLPEKKVDKVASITRVVVRTNQDDNNPITHNAPLIAKESENDADVGETEVVRPKNHTQEPSGQKRTRQRKGTLR